MPCAFVGDGAVAEPSTWVLPRSGSTGLAGRPASDLISTPFGDADLWIVGVGFAATSGGRSHTLDSRSQRHSGHWPTALAAAQMTASSRR